MLVDVRRHLRDIEVLDSGRRVRVQPGATLRHVNARLAGYGAKLGPDPASEVACTIGGIVANNSSGMTCGTEANSYRMLRSLVLVLPSGTVVDTGVRDADRRLQQLEPELYAGLGRLRDRVRGNEESRARIAQQYAIKNTMGYSLNAFVERDSPVRILEGLAVGSEGTLAFIAEATFETVPVKPHAATALLVFDDLRRANEALPALVETGLAAIELLDDAALRVAQRAASAPSQLREMHVARQAALLVEHQERSADELRERVASTDALLREVVGPTAALTQDPASRRSLWHIRKGLYATVAGARPSGTTALLEDIAVPPAQLAVVCEQLEQLFVRHGYRDSVIFGHAKDGNVHFLLSECFDQPDRMEAYERFTEDMVDLVLGHRGTLKAEHGTGRIMAPFVRRQFGDELYDVMLGLKRLCDPEAVLNPGVILSEDPRIHLQHIKPTVTVEPEVDRCVSCGFCEPVCPSRDLTLTPRQRILLRRELATAELEGDRKTADALRQEFIYDGVQTCAVDGMCQTACPVDINTGDLVRRLRAEKAGSTGVRLSRLAARHWGTTTRAVSAGLTMAQAAPPSLPRAVSSALRAVLGSEVVPHWDERVPAGGERRRPRPAAAPEAVFVPSCTGTLFAPAPESLGVEGAFLRLCDRAAIPVRVPDAIASLCCGAPWKSKGLVEGHAAMRRTVQTALLAATEQGRLPIVVDASSCTEAMDELLDAGVSADWTVIDVVTFARERLLPRLSIRDPIGHLALHPTCATVRRGDTDDLIALARAVADQVTVPDAWSCCAFAGDRGLLKPELTASATDAYAASVRSLDATAFASCNRTCEAGMSRATDCRYQHLIELLEEATRRC